MSSQADIIIQILLLFNLWSKPKYIPLSIIEKLRNQKIITFEKLGN